MSRVYEVTIGSGAGATAGTRDPMLWPFAADSIWNMPIGSGAVYLPLNMTAPNDGFGTDEVYLQFVPDTPLRPLVDRGYWWPWTSGTSVPGTSTGVSVRVPDAWVLPPPAPDEQPNRASAALLTDNATAQEWQYTVRPAAGSNISMFQSPRATFSLTGSGQSGSVGSHGGSGLTCIGGTIRAGELTGPDPIRHALAVTMNMAKWGTKQGGNITNGYRWPALSADAYWNSTSTPTPKGYGTLSGTSRDGLGMGSLVAVPANVDLGSLGFETGPGAKLAWTYQNYGAYVVDDSVDPGAFDLHRLNVEEAALSEYALDTWPSPSATPIGRDLSKIFTRLAVVDNNGPSSIGGGGAPLQPLAPNFT